MKKKIKLLSLMILLLFLIILPERVLAEERSLYVGDLIDIRITTQAFSVDEIREKFKDFEIVSLQEVPDGYNLTLRTFEPGERKIPLGDKEIIINVKSTLDDIKRDDIFEGSLDPKKAGFFMNWQVIFYLSAAILLLSGGIVAIRRFRKSKETSRNPFRHFILQTDRIAMEDDQFFVKLTFYLKEYLESKYACRIAGKTSSEILMETGALPGVNENLPLVQAWLLESDRCKFTGKYISAEQKKDMSRKLTELVQEIEAVKGEAS